MDMAGYGTIYVATSKTTGRSYVGQTSLPIDQRMKDHWSMRNDRLLFHRALKKYGLLDFEITTISNVPSTLLDSWEVFFISALGALAPDGYNLTTGGSSGRKLTAESIERIRAAMRKRMKGAKSPNPKTGTGFPRHMRLVKYGFRDSRTRTVRKNGWQLIDGKRVWYVKGAA